MATVSKNRNFFKWPKGGSALRPRLAPTAELSLTQDPIGNSDHSGTYFTKVD
jgi:hypothetical protein